MKNVTMPNDKKGLDLKSLLSSLAWQQRNLPWVLVALAVLALDLITKAWVSGSLDYGQRIQVLPVFDLVLLHNPGAAFSFLAEAGGWQRVFFVVLGVFASLFLWGWMNRLQPQEKLTALALALILGGALGNLHDRILHGYVVDFLAFHWNHNYFPAFNIADAGISVGAALIIWLAFFGKEGKT